MKLVVDNTERDMLINLWRMPDGSISLAFNPNRSLEVSMRLSKRSRAVKLLWTMIHGIDRWNAIKVDVAELSEVIGYKPKTIQKQLKELEEAGAFSKVDGDIYHFDEHMAFKPQYAPIGWLREVS